MSKMACLRKLDLYDLSQYWAMLWTPFDIYMKKENQNLKQELL
jgi:hypothetical protein